MKDYQRLAHTRWEKQISRGIYPEGAQESDIWSAMKAVGTDDA